jgi:hypothetical protein
MAKLNIPRTRVLLQQFEFKALFTDELGWERHSASLRVSIEGVAYELHAVAEKRGMVAFVCNPLPGGGIPDYAARRKIETYVGKTVHEHIIVYADRDKTAQVWQWVKREPGKPAACRERAYDRGQTGDPLIQRLQAIAFSLEEEEGLTIVDVTGRVRAAFDVERITKRFYDRFKVEHAAFLRFIEGIPDEEMQHWYASVMINRLMFIYFIQKKGFLDNSPNYLRSKLAETKKRGKNLFYSEFLCVLFFKGFAEKDRSVETKRLLGDVPYLNGGLFLRHQIEELHGKTIAMLDAAFEKLFDFFDAYQWNLDERPLRDDREINPDVLGYIFEKYINQKQMGAYYTKEDITEYIGKNTIIPCLFDKARQKCKIAFEGEASVWRLLQSDPDRYVYDAIKKGIDLELPSKIAAGLNDVSRRTDWNKPASAEYALPTEIWREVVARRKRYEEVREKLTSGEVRDINDLITYNLDIRQFAQDVITNSEGPELLRAFWRAIVGRIPEESNEKFENGIAILDPTCGSGAFLFAALNTLEPLYDACLDRMQVFIDDLDRSAEKHDQKKFSDFRKILERVERHPNHRYFVLKSIIINNLFGVDIMEEAVEICKLRLFLKLVAQVERGEQIEPLPDIDFNMRCGNTLVGYATYEDVERAGKSDLDFENSMSRIKEKAQRIDRVSNLFRQQQMEPGGEIEPTSKQELCGRLKTLEDELNVHLAGRYGIDANKKARFEGWLKSHKPFHWFIEFHAIMNSGGFAVVLGNPPWREYASVKKEYTVDGYTTEGCGNLHGIFTERALALRSNEGLMSFIVQLPLMSSSRMSSVRKVLREQSDNLYVIPFDDRPGKLFDGLQNCRSVILISQSNRSSNSMRLSTARYQRWPSETREYLFALFQYVPIVEASLHSGLFPKYAHAVEQSIFHKVKARAKHTLAVTFSRRSTNTFIFYQEATRYWIKATVGLPYYAKNGSIGAPAHGRYIYFDRPETAQAVSALLNSSLFYIYFVAYGDCFHLSDGLVSRFPVDPTIVNSGALVDLNERLTTDLKNNSETKSINTSTGDVIRYAEFSASKSKNIIDRIDREIAKHYGFTDEELDFIINYDIKYRMGRDSQNEEDE